MSIRHVYVKSTKQKFLWMDDNVVLLFLKYKEVIPMQLQKYMKDRLHSNPNFQAPQFYGIPKMYKTSLALRLIVPSHSWYTIELAKYISILFQPLVAQFPWVIQSIRNFVNILGGYRRNHTSKSLMCVGDVKSLYTSIPKAKLITRVRSLFKTFTHIVNTKYHNLILDGIVQCNSSNYFTYDGACFLQRKGLVIRVSYSPVLANFYMAFNKMKFTIDLDMYVRYIDDIFVLANKIEDIAIDYSEGLAITWKTDYNYIDFFNVKILQESNDNLEHYL